MKDNEFDVIVIGGGTAGLGAYRNAKELGKKCLIIEKNDFVTTCANVGCMPSKLLIAAAENINEIHRSSSFGINVPTVEVDFPKVMQRVRSERDRFVGFVKEGANKIDSKDRIIGEAFFTGYNSIVVNNKEYISKSFVIATGSRINIPPVLQSLKNELLTNENIFELNELPQSLAVIGAGVIGLELSFAFHHLGSKVTLINRHDKLLHLNDDINQYLVSHIKDNFDFIHDKEIISVDKIVIDNKNKYQINFKNSNILVDKILCVTGRIPNLDILDIKKHHTSEQKYNPKTTQLGNTNIFLAGDVNGDVPLLHEASQEAIIAGKNAGHYPLISQRNITTPISIIFSSPQIMQIGKTVFNPSDKYIKGTVSFENQGRSRVMLQNKGMLNIYFDIKNHELIGAEMIGPSAEHIAHLLAWQIEQKVTLEKLLSFPFYHPVIEEGLRTALRDAYSKI